MKERFPGVWVLVLGYYDLFDERSAELPSQLAHLRGISEWTKISNRILETHAQAQGFEFLDLRPIFLDHAYGGELGGIHLDPTYVRLPLRSFDIHPGTQGHKAIAEAMGAYFSTHPGKLSTH